ncbi:MAG: hemolysin III family protein [bacterium]|nr:hemolysin III family protein [bacterium]
MSNEKKPLKNLQGYTQNEEIANSITHGFGALLSIAGLSILVVLASLKGDVWRVVSFSIYGATLIILYLSSAFYHMFSNQKVKEIFHIFDHSAIFLLIAGTYTPFTLVTLRGAWGWSIFGVIWGIAIAGIIFKAFYTGRFDYISTILYVVMGWIVIIAIKPIVANLSAGGLVWLFIGGGCYTLGVIFYIWEKLPFNHAVWHLFVLAGSISHFFAILFHVLPMKNA